MATGEVESLIKFENFATVFIVGGNNIGRVGTMMSVEHHPGSYEIAHVKDTSGHTFSTRLTNTLVIGQKRNQSSPSPRAMVSDLPLMKRETIESRETLLLTTRKMIRLNLSSAPSLKKR